MNVTLVENAQDNVNRDDGRENEQRFIGQRSQKRLRRALEGRLNAGGHLKFLLRLVNGLGRLAQGRAGSEVEGNGHGRKLSLMIDRQWRGAGLKMSERAQWYRGAGGRGHVNIIQLGGISLEFR